MSAIPVLIVPLDTDLSPLTRHLWSKSVVHRVIEQDNKQVLLLANPNDIEEVKSLLEEWQTLGLEKPKVEHKSSFPGILIAIQQAPLTVFFILVFGLFYLYQQISQDWYSWTSSGAGLWPDQRNDISTYLELGLWGIWRHTLLHFGLVHILSNLFWMWIFGRALEAKKERTGFIALMLFCGLIGNILQWWLSGPSFGGVSGVVYGLAAWVWLRQTRYRLDYGIPSSLMLVMVVFILISITSDTLMPGLLNFGNGAHLGGLLTGLLLAFIWPVTNQPIKNQLRGQDSDDT